MVIRVVSQYCVPIFINGFELFLPFGVLQYIIILITLPRKCSLFSASQALSTSSSVIQILLKSFCLHHLLVPIHLVPPVFTYRYITY